jgi:uncharacterized RDD family membrane protein YckC
MTKLNETGKYAGFWIRSLALSVDYTIMVLPFALFFSCLILLILLFQVQLPFEISKLKPLLLVVFMLICVLYFVGFNSSEKQGTIGKRVCNIYLGNKNCKSRITKLKALGRLAFFGILLITNKLWRYGYDTNPDTSPWIVFLVLFSLLAFSHILAALTSQKTALHDILFKTRVYLGRPRIDDDSTNTKSYHIVFGVLLLTWGAAIPVFKMDDVVTIWSVVSLYVLMVLGALIFYKYKSPSIYAKYSISMALRSLRPLFYALIPSFILLLLTYGIVLYVKINMG